MRMGDGQAGTIDQANREVSLEASPEAAAAGLRAMIRWHEGSDSFEEGVRQIWLEMSLVQKGLKVDEEGPKHPFLVCKVSL